MKRTIIPLLFLAVMWVAVYPATSAFPQDFSPWVSPETDIAANLRVFKQVWDKINKYYFDPEFNGANCEELKETYRPQIEQAKNTGELVEVLNRMLGEIGSSHLSVRYVMDIKRKEFEQKTGNRIRKGDVWVVGPSKEGHKGTYRFRDLKDKEVALSLTSEFYQVSPEPQINWKALEESIFYVQIRGFGPGVGDRFKDAMGNFQKANAKAMIVDLQSNGGGKIKEAIKCLSPFFKDDVKFGCFRKRKGGWKTEKVKGWGRKAFNGDVVVLTDEYTASAGEIFSAVIRDNHRETIIGRKTPGAVLYCHEFDLPGNIVLTVPTRDYQTPKGVRLEGKGVVPDVIIGESTIDDIRKGRDRAMEVAIEFLGRSGIKQPNFSLKDSEKTWQKE